MQVKAKRDEVPQKFPARTASSISCSKSASQFCPQNLDLRSQYFHPISRRITWEGVCGCVLGHPRSSRSRALRPVRRSCSRHFGRHWPQGREGGQSLGWGGGLRSGCIRKHQDHHRQQEQLRSTHRAAGLQKGATGP